MDYNHTTNAHLAQRTISEDPHFPNRKDPIQQAIAQYEYERADSRLQLCNNTSTHSNQAIDKLQQNWCMEDLISSSKKSYSQFEERRTRLLSDVPNGYVQIWSEGSNVKYKEIHPAHN